MTRPNTSRQHALIIALSSPTKVTLDGPDDTFPFSNIWEGKDTKYRHTGNNKSASYKYRTKTTSSNILKPTPSNHESLREGAIKHILPQKGEQKASTLEGESAITPVSYQVEQIAPPLTREGAINHILCPIELPTPSPNLRESAMKKLPRRVVKGKPRNTVPRDITRTSKRRDPGI